MGIIIKQSIKGSIWSYLGVGVGFITTAYLFPNYLTTDTIGLFGLLISWSVLLSQFFSLGINGVTERLFPYFRNKKNGHNGYLFIAFTVLVAGFGLFLAAYYIFSPWLIESNLEKSRLFSEYIYLLVPLTLFTLIYNVLDSYNKLLYDAVFGTFLIEFLQRVLILLTVCVFIFGLINITQLIMVYAGVVSVKGAVIFFYLLFKGEISLKPRLNFIDKQLGKEMLNVALFSILIGMGSNIVLNIDKIIVNEMLGLSVTGIYTIAFFFGTLVIIPSRPLQRISGTLIADAWRRNDLLYIEDIYKRSSLNQFIIGAFLFGGIWVNIDSIFIILGPEYYSGKWVIFFIGLGYLFEMASGGNALIITYSKYYKLSLWFLLVQIAIFIFAMFIFIPLWGITGAGLAVTLAFMTNNLIRYLFLYRKYKMQPFSNRFFLVIFVFLIAYFSGYIISDLPLVWDILCRGSVFAIIYLAATISLRLSEDVNSTIIKILKIIKI